MSLSDALNTRDALAKALYSQLFTWLVHKINRIINPTVQQHQSVALLDIFGFEVRKLLPEDDMQIICEFSKVYKYPQMIQIYFAFCHFCRTN